MPAGDHHLAPVDVQRAVLGVDAEDLWRGPAQAYGLGAKALDKISAGLVDVRPGGGADIAVR
jgi:hypothetical protein